MSSRKREFSNQRIDLTKSNLSKSRNQLNSSRINTPTRISKYQIATPHSNKHPSNSSQNNNNLQSDFKLIKKSSSDYICVGCFNEKLANDKKKHIRDQLLKQKQQERLDNQALVNHTHQQYVKHSQQQKEIKEIKNYNQQIIEHKRQQKAKQKSLQQQLNFQQKQQQQRIQREERIKLKQKQTIIGKYKAVIKQQINQKQQKSHQMSPFEIQGSVNDVFGKSAEEFFKEKTHREQLYREELLKQIKDRHQRVKQQAAQNQKIQNVGSSLTETAYKRQIERKKKLDDRQQQIFEEAKRITKMREKQLYQEQLRRQKLQEQRIQQERAQQEEQRKYRQQKQKQTESYLVDLKQQIQSSKRKKQQEERQMHYFINTSMQFEQKQPERKSCKSCDKKFPKTFLTKIN